MSATPNPILDPSNPPGLGPDPRKGRLSLGEIERWAEGLDLPESRLTLVKALALLWHDHLDEAHELVQDHSSGDGAYLHGIMHRREPDYWNSKYWFGRVGGHPFFGSFGARVAEMPGGEPFVLGGLFEAGAFVDAVERAVRRRGTAEDEQRLVAIQAAEFLALWDKLTE